jgi:hypothetical protein
MHVYNKLHAGYRVRVEWGIGGLKWKKLIECFNSKKLKMFVLYNSYLNQLLTYVSPRLHIQNHKLLNVKPNWPWLG